MDDLLPLWFLYFSCHTVDEHNVTVVTYVCYYEQTTFIVTALREHDAAGWYSCHSLISHCRIFLTDIGELYNSVGSKSYRMLIMG